MDGDINLIIHQRAFQFLGPKRFAANIGQWPVLNLVASSGRLCTAFIAAMVISAWAKASGERRVPIRKGRSAVNNGHVMRLVHSAASTYGKAIWQSSSV
jgi:hypothetical protein